MPNLNFAEALIILIKREVNMVEKISFTLNGKPTSLTVDGDRMLLWVLRTDLGLTGTKYGCGKALCGACTVIVDGKAVRSCVVPVRSIKGERGSYYRRLGQKRETPSDSGSVRKA